MKKLRYCWNCGAEIGEIEDRFYDKSGSNPHLFCPRCDRAFDSNSGEQIENWAWKRVNGSQAMFVKVVRDSVAGPPKGREP